MSNKKRPQNWPAEQKLKTVQEYDTRADEEARGRFLRERGLYSVDVERWREEMLQSLGKKPNRKDPKNQRIKELESALRRKEKALAETAAPRGHLLWMYSLAASASVESEYDTL